MLKHDLLRQQASGNTQKPHGIGRGRFGNDFRRAALKLRF